MPEGVMVIGESFIGEGPEAAHVNTVLGRRGGPVGVAWTAAAPAPPPASAPGAGPEPGA